VATTFLYCLHQQRARTAGLFRMLGSSALRTLARHDGSPLEQRLASMKRTLPGWAPSAARSFNSMIAVVVGTAILAPTRSAVVLGRRRAEGEGGDDDAVAKPRVR
jgi:hypothetical protein